MVQHPGDQRVLYRAACQIEAWQADSNILLGTMQDVGLGGAFVGTDTPLPLHAVFTVRFEIAGSEVTAQAEVVRVTDAGMGLRFIGRGHGNARALRRYVIDAIGDAAYLDVAERMHQGGATWVEPVTDPHRIIRLVRAGEKSAFLMLVKGAATRHEATVAHMTGESMTLSCKQDCDLSLGQEVFVLYARDYESYSFKTTVRHASGHLCELHIPERLLYSERRASARRPLEHAFFTFKTGPKNVHRYPVLETSEQGLSIRIDQARNDLWPGVILREAQLVTEGQKQPLHNATVQHVSRMLDKDGTEWFRVGLSFGNSPSPVDETREVLLPSDSGQRKRDKLAQKLRAAVQGGMYLAHTRVMPQILGPREAFTVLDLPNAAGKPMVALLNTTWKPTPRKVEATVVLVAPGLGARKETMGALAYLLTHLFEQEGKEVAVLRWDGINNVGESYKEPGCNVEGKQTLNYSITDGIDDLAGAFAWAQSNATLTATELVIVSVSLSSIAVRHALAHKRLKGVSFWVSFMGASDAANALMHAGGHIDCYSNHLAGIKNGQVAMMGCLVDADRLCRDMQNLKVATLADAERDMSAIDADVLWVAGTQDAYMDIKRTRRCLGAASQRKRRIIEVDAGHAPQSGEEAVAEFALIGKAILKHVGVEEPRMHLASIGWLDAMSEREWRRVRKPREAHDRERWWAAQMSACRKVGEVLEMCPDYMDLIERQAAMVPAEAKHVVDLGCGFGTLTERLLKNPNMQVTAVDFAEAALKFVQKRGDPKRLFLRRHSIDGNTVTAIRRWVRRELPEIHDAIGDLPAEKQKHILRLVQLNDTRISRALRGEDVDFKSLTNLLQMSQPTATTLMDCHALARYATGRLDVSELPRHLSAETLTALHGAALMPFATDSIDAVTCSLVLNFLKRPDDTVSEAYRMLKRSGRLVVSAYVEDAEMSELCLDLIAKLKRPEGDWPYPREALIDAARTCATFFSQMRHLEEEGTFHRLHFGSLAAMLERSGFVDITTHTAVGNPARVIVASGVKP